MSVTPFGATSRYLDALNTRQQTLAEFKKNGWGGVHLEWLEHPENDEGLQKMKRAAEQEQANMADSLTPKPVTITGQLPASITDALVNGTAESARLGARLQRMLSHVADLNNALKTTTPEAYAELLQDMDQAHADEYMGGRRQELQRLRADPVESIADRLVNLGFSVSGQLFRTGADGQVELGEATISGKGLTLEVSGQTGFNLRLDSTPTPIRAEALSPPIIQSAPATLPDSQPASQSVVEVEKMLDRSFARMDTHNALLSQLKPENIEVVRARSGDGAAETYRQDIERKIAQLRFDPAELAPRLAEKGLEFLGALAEKQADGSYARSHFLISGKMPGGSAFSYDSLGGAFLGTELGQTFKLPTRQRGTTAPAVSAPRIQAVA